MASFVLLAHIDRNSHRAQTLAAHSENVAELCGKFCGKIGLESLGRLVGLLHDSGKATNAFQTYLKMGDDSMRGKIPHSFCGARYSPQKWESGGAMEDLTAEFAAAAICAHHGGLPDVTGVDASDNLHRRAWPEKEVCYEEALKGFFQDISPQSLDWLFREAQREMGRTSVRTGSIHCFSASFAPKINA